mmetsp:Transcript_5440/g.15243  ORF Transcript_5440/g.15243 Transcript_5440/m.15243 type:complete len:221 (+) Transcript_5440:43-705(+)
MSKGLLPLPEMYACATFPTRTSAPISWAAEAARPRTATSGLAQNAPAALPRPTTEAPERLATKTAQSENTAASRPSPTASMDSSKVSPAPRAKYSAVRATAATATVFTGAMKKYRSEPGHEEIPVAPRPTKCSKAPALGHRRANKDLKPSNSPEAVVSRRSIVSRAAPPSERRTSSLKPPQAVRRPPTSVCNATAVRFMLPKSSWNCATASAACCSPAKP